ncbi:HGL310Wp [Eremothecium sinecaudum]|uniref:HGL310Wp n=1 Tax=Eremothecium sinecaudum TaxID=45286 RepID=A0A0X8HV29_9SACH|nr:HGL310Wp [Eremothecium sinecaudum]AMD22030.1 HGL310Wp [Eremothecium sinecaudum]
MVNWVAIIYDKPGVDRTPYLEEHIKTISPLFKQGKIKCGGPIFKEVVDGEASEIIGANIVFETDNKEEVIEIFQNDVFVKEGIWDLDTLILHPVKYITLSGQEEE